MNKSNYFFGQSVFGQLISLIDLSKINTISRKHMADHYVKKFDTSDHLISMLFSNLASFCRLHLFNYIHLLKFLENPQKDWLKEYDPQLQLKFSSS